MSINRGYNDLKIDSFKYEWTIKKFGLHVKLWHLPDDKSYYNKSITIKSPFFLDDNHNKWYLDLLIYSNSNSANGSCSYQVTLKGAFQGEQQEAKKKMEIQWTVVNNNTKNKCDGNDVYSIFNCCSNGSHSVVLGDIPFGIISNDIRHSHDDITIICQFNIVVDSFTSAINNSVSRVAKRNLPIDIEELFINKKFTDITFILGDKKIKAHKLILITLSPVFAAMFSNPMKEQENNEVVIKDIDYDVFEEMIQYIYTDDATYLKCPVTKLLYAADKYGLEDLKETCTTMLRMEMTVDNAAETYVFAEQHNITQLAAQVQCFINEHIQDFLKTSGYESMVDEYPELAKKVFRSPESELSKLIRMIHDNDPAYFS